jgi:hypothetical protein
MALMSRIKSCPLANWLRERQIPRRLTQVRAIVITDESVREARVVREAQAADSGFPQGFAEDAFIAQLYNRSMLLNSGFQVISGPARNSSCNVYQPKS